MICITQGGVVVREGALSVLKEEFEATGIATLPGFLSPAVLNPLMRQVDSASYAEKAEVSSKGRVFGTTLKLDMTSRNPRGALFFILNRPPLFRAVHEITGCPMPGNFLARIHRTVPGAGQHIDWHHDVSGSRVLGLDLNLSGRPFSGGEFQLRDSGKVVKGTVSRWSPGDAFLFRIDDSWEHRLTEVTSGERTVGVGWFQTSPDWVETLQRLKAGLPLEEATV